MKKTTIRSRLILLGVSALATASATTYTNGDGAAYCSQVASSNYGISESQCLQDVEECTRSAASISDFQTCMLVKNYPLPEELID